MLTLFSFGLETSAAAQQIATGQNFNVNPGTVDQYVGDKYLQRQVEPKIVCASNNTQLCLGIANDYRTVDMTADSQTGFGEATLRDLFGPNTRLVAAPDAWLGLYRTSNGRNFLNGLVPGFPQDTSPLGLRQPWYGLAAGSDGSLATDGVHFYGAGLFFNRGGRSMIGAFRLTAYNDESTHPIRWDDGFSRVIELGSATSTGLFADLPSIVTDAPRGLAECGNVYMAYTRFSGAPVGNSFIYFSRSSDCGMTYSKPVKISGTYNMTQRVVIAIDPRQGTPPTTGGGTLYAVFRTFQPDQFVFAKSIDYGTTWTSPAPITNRSNPSTLCTYDQPTVGTIESTNPSDYTARAMTFASVQVDSTGKLHVVWTERVDPGTGLPLSGSKCTAQPLKQPKIVYTSSSDTGKTWSLRKAIDMSSRCETKAVLSQAAGLDRSSPSGGCPDQNADKWLSRPSGPQIQPVLAHNAGKLMLLYSEGRANPGTAKFLGSTGYHSGINTQMDARVAQIKPTTGALISTTQISRYAIDATTNGLKDVGNSPGSKAYNRPYLLQYKGGTVPFKGDHDDLVPMEKFIWESPPHFARPGEVPGVRFLSIWGGDNREALFPGGVLSGDWWDYKYVDPSSGLPPSCNAGIRNSNNYAAYVGPPIEAFVHQSFKPPFTFTGGNKQRTWVVTVRNHSSDFRTVKFSLDERAGNASFDQFHDVNVIGNQQSNPSCLNATFPACTAYRTLLPYSSLTFTAFGKITDATVPAPFRINVYEKTSTGETLAAIVRLNPNPNNPVPLVGTDIATKELHGPSIAGPYVSTHGNPTQGNPTQGNPTQGNPTQGNPTQGNPTQGNPTQGNAGFGEYTDYRYVVTATSGTDPANTISGYSAFASIPTDVDASHLVQMIITRRHKVPTLGPNCAPTERIDDEVISTITASSVSQLSPTQGNPTQGNPTQGNPTQGNPTQGNPTQGNPTQGNNTFALSPQSSPAAGPSAAATYVATAIASAVAQAVSSIASDISPDGTLVGQPEPDEVHVTFRFFHCDRVVGCDTLTLPDGTTRTFTPETPSTTGEAVPKSCDGSLPSTDTAPCASNSLAGGLMSMTTKIEAGNNIDGAVTPPIDVVTGPDLALLGAPTVVPPSVGTPGRFRISGFTIANVGDADAGPTTYMMVAVPQAGSPLISLGPERPIPAIAAGGSWVETSPNFGSTLSGLLPGSYTVGPLVDYGNMVGERNEFNNFAGASLTVTSAQPPAALTITTTSLAGATVWTGYNATVAATGGTAPYTWSILSGRLPAGLSIDAPTGQISGAPVSSGKNHTLVVQVQDDVGQTATMPLTIRVTGASFAITDTDFASAGVGGTWGSGSGTLTIAGIPITATVTKALLYWQGPTISTNPAINASVVFDDHSVTGTNIGFSQPDCWGPPAGANFINCQAYRVDVTGYVSSTQTNYSLAGFRKETGGAIDAVTQGISLLVFYDDGNPSNNKNVYLFDGTDSNMASEFDATGWEMTMTPVNFPVGSTASLQLHVAGGQVTTDQGGTPTNDGELVLNGQILVPEGLIFQGDSVPPNQPPNPPSGLWDIKDFDISSFVNQGTTTLSLTSPIAADCSSLVVAAVVVTPNPGGGALQFDGVDDFVNVPYQTSLNLSSVTAEAWVKIDDPNFTEAPLLSKGANYGNYTLGVLKNSTTGANVSYVHAIPTGNFSCCSVYPDGPISFGVWTHVAATFDATTGTSDVYVNGARILGSGPGWTVAVQNVQALLLGRATFTSPPDLNLRGVLDEVRVWNYARSAAEIAANYNKVIPSGTPGLVGYWQFDEAQGFTALDSSGSGNAGTLGAVPATPTRVLSTAPIIR